MLQLRRKSILIFSAGNWKHSGKKFQENSAIFGSHTKAKIKHQWAWNLSEYENNLQCACVCEIIGPKMWQKSEEKPCSTCLRTISQQNFQNIEIWISGEVNYH